MDLREQGLELPHQTTINGQRPHQYRLPRLLADQEIQPPRDVQEAMNRRLSAERTRRATVTRVRRQPLQTTSNGSLESSGKYSPFCTNALDVPVHLLAEVGEAPQDGTGWHQAFRQDEIAM